MRWSLSASIAIGVGYMFFDTFRCGNSWAPLLEESDDGSDGTNSDPSFAVITGYKYALVNLPTIQQLVHRVASAGSCRNYCIAADTV